MKLLDRHSVPPELWTLEIPETGYPAAGGDFNDLVRVVAKHYSSNNIPCDDPEARTEELLCQRLDAQGHKHFLVPEPAAPPDYRVENPTLTVAYMTNRRDCRIEWFLDSLDMQQKDLWARGRNQRNHVHDVMAVDYFKDERQGEVWNRLSDHIAPKPNVWSGPHKLTKVDYFAAASARNTALCYAESTHIAFVDDLSVLLPGWLESVWDAIEQGYIGLGAYKKVRNLEVDGGVVRHYDPFPAGTDNRLAHVNADLTPCAGNWLFGCSFVAPVEALLDVGGSPEMCDSTGLGSEDYCLGIALANRGNQFRYDRRMMTLESEELHHTPGQLQVKRMDKGISPNDKSHTMLAHAQVATYYPIYYPGGIRALRKYVQAGNEFPVVDEPKVDWYDGQSLSEL